MISLLASTGQVGQLVFPFMNLCSLYPPLLYPRYQTPKIRLKPQHFLLGEAISSEILEECTFLSIRTGGAHQAIMNMKGMARYKIPFLPNRVRVDHTM